MFSIFFGCKFFPVKKIAIDSTARLVFVHKNQLLVKPASSKAATNQLYFNVSSLLHASGLCTEAAISSKTSSNRDSHTLSYLINSCGLSQETAISVSEKVRFKTPERPDSVLSFFRKHEFSKIQIAKLARKRPVILLSNPEKTFLPKFEFFQSIGVSNTDLAIAISKDPSILTRSLKNQIIPTYNFLKSVLRSNEKIVAATKRTIRIFLEDYKKNLAPNIAVLRELGVPESCIRLLLTHFPEATLQKHNQFRETVTEVREMGFDQLKTMFVLAVHVLSGKSNKSIWDRCYEAYRQWGWSRDEILLAFRKHPHCMILSKKKISGAMEFLVNKMGWQSSVIAGCPTVLFFSLERRIIPRCSVIQVLSLKGLINKNVNVSLSTVLIPAEKYFLEKFVTKYEQEVPLLLGVYRGTVDVLEL